jgi:hypothetical protein
MSSEKSATGEGGEISLEALCGYAEIFNIAAAIALGKNPEALEKYSNNLNRMAEMEQKAEIEARAVAKGNHLYAVLKGQDCYAEFILGYFPKEVFDNLVPANAPVSKAFAERGFRVLAYAFAPKP